MSMEIDLRDYKEDFADYYCNPEYCLKDLGEQAFLQAKLKNYIEQMEKDYFVYKKTKNIEEIIRDLRNLL